MSFLAMLKVAALAAALLCLGSIGPGLLLAGVEQPANKSPSVVSHCRLYFGCVPLALVREPLEEEPL
jgi:hypothetical protein